MTDVHTDMCLLEGCLVTVVASVDKANDKLLDVVVDSGLTLPRRSKNRCFGISPSVGPPRPLIMSLYKNLNDN